MNNTKKKILLTTSFLMMSIIAMAQVGIGKTQLDGTKSIVEFEEDSGRGLILPWIETLPTGNALHAGVLIYDATSSSEMKVKYYDGNAWQNLGENTSTIDRTALLSLQSGLSEASSGGSYIGGNTSATEEGVLVLADDTMAMVLPKENSYKNIKSPVAGTLIYDTTIDMMCVYNGTEWAFFDHP